MKQKFILVILFTLVAVWQVVAAPARGEWITVEQPDGTTVVVRLCGDEFHHFYMTQEGKSVICGEDGYFYYTTLDANNNLVVSTIKVGAESSDINHAAVMKRHGELNYENRASKNHAIATRRAPMRKSVSKAATAAEVKGLIILVNFKDLSFRTSQTTLNNMMNKEGYTDSYGSIGSARDYFMTQSYGRYVPDFDVVGPVTLSRNMSYYGGNDTSGSDSNADVMVSEACQLASNQGLVDMSDYDLDGDGWVDLVYVIFAGHGENYQGVDEDAVWPHAWYIYQGAGRTVKIDGVYLDAYACSAELYGATSTRVDGIGTFCHEFSHTLGLPDFYDIDYSGAMGMSEWSVMASGCYAEYGYVPIAYNAFERYSCGWLTLNELNEPATIEMPDLNTDRTAAYRISSSNSNQYITLETRTNDGWDKGLPAEGMMVVAIDYNQTAWNNNGPNDDPSRQRVKLIPADNKWSEDNLSGDLYPYGGNNELTSTSTPAMKVYNTTISNKPVTNIVYNQGVTTFDFMGGEVFTIDVPTAYDASGVMYDAQNNAQFTANWEAVDGAESYTLYIERWVDKVVTEPDPDDPDPEDPDDPVDPEEPTTPTVIFQEDFAKFTANESTDISTKLDSYTQVSGWSGSKVFCGKEGGEARLGSNRASGKLTTPAIDLTSEFTITFHARSYSQKDESGTLTISIANASGSGSVDFAMSDLPASETMAVTVTGSGGADATKISFDCTKRICIDNLEVLNGVAASNAELKASLVVDENAPRQSVTQEYEKEIIETRTVEGITTTEFLVTEVETPVMRGALYRYKVKAVTDEGESEWSNEVDVEIYFPTDINTAASLSRCVYAADGTIYMHNVEGEYIIIYNMQGVVVARCPAMDGYAQYTPATAGIYLVSIDGVVTKVLVTD